MNKIISITLSLLMMLTMMANPLLAAQDESPDLLNTDRFGIEKSDNFARSELVLYQTIHGLILGIEFCGLIQCDDERLAVGSVMAGGLGGLAVSLLNTDGGITSGHTLMLNSGTTWGLWNGFALNMIFDNWTDEQLFSGTMMAAQLGGLGAAVYLWDQLRPQAGDVALMDSTGFWSGILTLMGVAALDLDMSTQEFFTLMLAATDLGAVTGAYYTIDNPMPRGRVFLLNTGGVIGAAVGFGMAVMIFGEDVDQSVSFGSGFLGTLAGLGLSFMLSDGWQLDLSSI